MHPDAIHDLIATFNSRDSCSLVDAQTALIALGTPAIAPLIDALEHEDDKIAAMAAQTLGKMAATEAYAALVAALDAFEWAVREQAALALGRLGDARAITVLKHAQADPAAPVQRAATHALHAIATRR